MMNEVFDSAEKPLTVEIILSIVCLVEAIFAFRVTGGGRGLTSRGKCWPAVWR